MLKRDSIKKDILKRYASTDTGEVIIDVSASRVQDLYDDFDKTAPYMRKDLEEQLVHYLLDCTREIGSTKFVIRFNLDEQIDMDSNLRVKESIKTYFSYLKELEIRNLRGMLRKSFFLLGIGAVILMLSLWIRNITATNENVFFQVIGEGLTVAAWVSLWEALATFLLEWAPTRKEIRLCDRLSQVQIFFAYPSKP
jgi:hypothetical protein